MAARSSRPAGIAAYSAPDTASDLDDMDHRDVPHGADAMFTRATSSLHDTDPGAGFFKTQQDGPNNPEATAQRCACHRRRCRAATRGEVFLIVAASVLLMGITCTAVVTLTHASGDLERRHAVAQAENRVVVADVAASLAGIATTLGAFNSVLSGRCDSIDPEVWESAASSLTASLPPTCALEVVGTVQVAPVNRTAFETKWATALKDKDGQPLPAGDTAYPALWVYPDPTTNPRRFRDLGADGLCPTLLAAPISLPTSRTGFRVSKTVEGDATCGYTSVVMCGRCFSSLVAQPEDATRSSPRALVSVTDVATGQIVHTDHEPGLECEESTHAGTRLVFGLRELDLAACESKDAFHDRDSGTFGVFMAVAGSFTTLVCCLMVYAFYRHLASLHSELSSKQIVETAAITHGRIMTYLCHELRNPLLGVRGSLELLLLDHGESLPSDAMQDVRAASRNAEVMHRVLDDVLDQRRIIAGTVDVRPRRSDVRVLLRDIGNQMRAYLAPRSRIELRVDPAIPPAAMVDVTRVRQILANAVHNACRATPNGAVLARLSVMDALAGPLVPRGSVRRLSGKSLSPRRVSRMSPKVSRSLVWDITNEGCGLPEDVKALFDGAGLQTDGGVANQWDPASHSSAYRRLLDHLSSVTHLPLAADAPLATQTSGDHFPGRHSGSSGSRSTMSPQLSPVGDHGTGVAATSGAGAGAHAGAPRTPTGRRGFHWSASGGTHRAVAANGDQVMRFTSLAYKGHLSANASASTSTGSGRSSDRSSRGTGVASDTGGPANVAQGIGAGLGLPLCAALAAKLGGTMGLRDVVDLNGAYLFTHFYLVLPLELPLQCSSDEEDDDDDPAVPVPPPPSPNRYRRHGSGVHDDSVALEFGVSPSAASGRRVGRVTPMALAGLSAKAHDREVSSGRVLDTISDGEDDGSAGERLGAGVAAGSGAGGGTSTAMPATVGVAPTTSVDSSAPQVIGSTQSGPDRSMRLHEQPSSARDAAVDATSRRVARPPGAPNHIVVVDDERMVRKLATRMLAKCGVSKTTQLADGSELLPFVDAQRPDSTVDVILLDIVMKASNGVDTASQVRRANIDVPMFAMTANVDDASLEQYRNVGFDGVLGKPFTVRDVRRLLEHVRKLASQVESMGVGATLGLDELGGGQHVLVRPRRRSEFVVLGGAGHAKR